MELHPLCTFFPRIEESAFEDLKNDIATNGQVHPIITYQGMILDGGNRYRACIELDINPIFKNYAGDNPVAYVLSANLQRRHLKEGQRAAIVAAAQDWERSYSHGGNRKGFQESNSTLDSSTKRSEISNVSKTTQKIADKIAEKSPELIKKVASGEMSLNAADVELHGKKKSTLVNQEFIDNLNKQLTHLEEEVEQLEYMLKVTTDENEHLKRILNSDNKVDQAIKEVERYRDHAHKIELRCNGLIGENTELIRRVKALQKKIS